MTYEEVNEKYFAPLSEICEALLYNIGLYHLSSVELREKVKSDKELIKDLKKYEDFTV